MKTIKKMLIGILMLIICSGLYAQEFKPISENGAIDGINAKNSHHTPKEKLKNKKRGKKTKKEKTKVFILSHFLSFIYQL